MGNDDEINNYEEIWNIDKYDRKVKRRIFYKKYSAENSLIVEQMSIFGVENVAY